MLECNARFGDPEAQVMLPRLAVALGPILLAAARGDLSVARRALGLDGALLPVVPGAAVGIVLAAHGYPDRPRSGDPIRGLDVATALGALVFHAGTARDETGTFTTHGGRILTVVGRGADLAGARDLAEDAAEVIAFDGSIRRHDIAAPPVAEAVR
jgi:phosphoribosylamine--glycine ligase